MDTECVAETAYYHERTREYTDYGADASFGGWAGLKYPQRLQNEKNCTTRKKTVQ